MLEDGCRSMPGHTATLERAVMGGPDFNVSCNQAAVALLRSRPHFMSICQVAALLTCLEILSLLLRSKNKFFVHLQLAVLLSCLELSS